MIESKIRKWGNSYGLLLTKGELEERNLKVDDTVRFEPERLGDISELFGTCKFEEPIEEIIREMKEGWHD